MQTFKCHKIVQAGKIAQIIVAEGGVSVDGATGAQAGEFVLVLEDQQTWTLEARHRPAVGGYLVVYAYGYKSYSPAEVFEAGYRPVAELAAEADRRIVERLARTCHEANRAYCLATGEDPATVYGPWAQAPEAIRESARIGVRAARNGMTPAELHQSWCDTKTADGWIYGPVKDLELRQHPCLVPYPELPAVQQVKDSLFHAIVLAG